MALLALPLAGCAGGPPAPAAAFDPAWLESPPPLSVGDHWHLRAGSGSRLEVTVEALEPRDGIPAYRMRVSAIQGGATSTQTEWRAAADLRLLAVSAGGLDLRADCTAAPYPVRDGPGSCVLYAGTRATTGSSWNRTHGAPEVVATPAGRVWGVAVAEDGDQGARRHVLAPRLGHWAELEEGGETYRLHAYRVASVARSA